MSYWTKRRKILGEVQHILTEIVDTEIVVANSAFDGTF